MPTDQMWGRIVADVYDGSFSNGLKKRYNTQVLRSFTASSSPSSARLRQMEDAASPWWERSLEPSALSTLDSVANQGRSWLEASAQKKFLNQVKPRSIDAITAITTQQAATFPSRSVEPRCLGRLEVYSRAFHALIESVPACQVRAPWRCGVCVCLVPCMVCMCTRARAVWRAACAVRRCGALSAVCLVQYCAVQCCVQCLVLCTFIRNLCVLCVRFHGVLCVRTTTSY